MRNAEYLSTCRIQRSANLEQLIGPDPKFRIANTTKSKSSLPIRKLDTIY
jgi:hypothetical protein